MDAESESKETFFKYTSDFVNNMFYSAGMFSGYLFKSCQSFKAAIKNKTSGRRKLTIKYLVRDDTKVDNDAKEDFYLNLGRDIVRLTKSDPESENLIVIDSSKYKY